MDRDQTLLAKIGACLIFIQKAEHTLRACAASMPGLTGINLSAEDFLCPDQAKRKHTLGQLLKPIKSSIPLGELDARLTTFLDNRNLFAHNYWVDASKVWPIDNSSYEKAIKYVDELISEAIELDQVFRGLFGVIVRLTAEKLGTDIQSIQPSLLQAMDKQSSFYKALGFPETSE
jgi:hypothetical protein